MTIHVVCRDCDFEALVDDADADVTVETHEEETGHNVDDGRVDGGATVMTDSGANTVEIDRGTLEELTEWGKARLERSGESPSTLADAVDAAEEALRVDDDETRLVTDGGRQPVEKMSVDELREEYRERADIGYSDPEEHDRKMALWNELRDRVDVEQPGCPECGERNWGQAPGEPKKCNACGSPLGEPELAEDIQQAWNEIMRGDGDENEPVTDGGKPTLALTDDGLEIPEGVSLADGVVVRARGATVDHKPGSEEQSFYPMIDQRHLHAEGREAVNDQLADDEVTVKQYGEDAETYRVVIPETDGGNRMVNALVLLDEDGGDITYDGPFQFLRDGGNWELVVPVGEDDYAGIHEQTAENLTDREDDLALALADGGVEASGRIEAAVVEEQRLVFRVDDGNHLSPSDVDIDLSEAQTEVNADE